VPGSTGRQALPKRFEGMTKRLGGPRDKPGVTVQG
jgi:hypothetical protein